MNDFEIYVCVSNWKLFKKCGWMYLKSNVFDNFECSKSSLNLDQDT